MSIIIHFNPAPYIPTVGTIQTSACLKASTAKLEMAPGIKHDTDGPVMTDDSSIVDLATSNTLYVEHMKDVKAANHHVTQSISCCFGLPYQDHNYGAPPPPTPPSYSPCPSPVRTNGTPDEETNLSVVPASNVCEETHEGSVTRCVCGFEHDDEYMICCDRCLVWQHVDCMGLDRNNMPDTYMCEKCEPRKVDRHKAKVLQARKKVAMTDSSDSDDTAKNSERRPKTRNKSSRRKKEEDKGDEKSENVPTKRSRNARNGKERMEIKRSKLRRNNKNKESTSTADEEAQDAWEYSVELCDKHFEAAINNQYTPEVQLIARTLQNQCRDVKSLEQLQVQLCQVDLIEGNRKRLFAACDIPRGQPLIEYKGKFLLTSQFYELNPMFNKRLYPYVLFYSLHQDEICVDASLYGNDARFIRRSCKPNSEICHAAFNGNVHLYISSTKEIFKDEEITIPFDFCHNDSIKDIDCACEKEFCVLRHNKKNGDGEVCERKRRLRRFTSSADDDSSHSLIGLTSSPVKSKQSPVKNSSSSQISPVSTSLMDHMDMKGTSDQEPEEQANERRRKMTREERKIDAIMRAFDQMEKAAKRRQQTLDRMAQQRGQHPLPKTEEKQKAVEKQEVVASPVKEEPVLLPPPTVVSETSCVEEEKPLILTPIPKPKKGKRRRGSGTQTRRRTRTNSGGSDIMSPDEKPPPPPSQLLELPPISPAPPASENYAETISSASVAEGTTPVQESCVESPQTPVRKTKRLLLQEWMHEKSETTPPPACSSLQTEVSWTAASRDAAPTCYVRCTKDGPNAGGILAHHLRRSSSSGQLRPTAGGGQGSAKKRWLRQAMYDCNTPDELSLLDQSSMEALSSPLHNGCLSPNSQGEANSPGVSADDVVITPLKKRRLMRESIESMPSPKSPSSIQTSIDWTTSTASCQSSSDSKTDLLLMEAATDSEGSVKDEKGKIYHLQIKTKEPLSPKINGLRDDIFMKSLVTSCESNDMKIEVTSTPVSSGGNVSVNSRRAIDINNLMFKTESTEKIQDICLDVSQNSCCADNEIVDANIVPVEKTENFHTFNDNLNTQSTNSKNSVATSDNTSPLLCNQTSHKDNHHNSELTFCETEHSTKLDDCKVEHLLPQQCVEEQSTAQSLDEEHLTTKLCEGAHFAMKQCVEGHLVQELHKEEKLITKQNKREHLTIKLCVEEILAPKLCEENLAPKLCEENLAPKLCAEENFSSKLCEEENIIIKTQNEGEHLSKKLCDKQHLAPKLCENEHLASKPCEEEKIITKLNEGEHSKTKLYEGEHLTIKMCGEEHYTHQPCEVEHLTKKQCNEEYLTVKQCGKEIETPKLHVEDHSTKQLEENLSLKECEKENLISVHFQKKSSVGSADSVSLSDVCNTVSDAINVEISDSISEIGLSADCASPKLVDDFTSLTEVLNTVQSKILLETNASNGDSSAGMDTSENPIALEINLCPISSNSDVHSVPVSSSVCSMSSESNSATVSNSIPISTSKVQSSSSENVVASVCSSSSASVAIVVSRSPSTQPSSGSMKLKKSVDSVSKAISSPKKSAIATMCASATQKRKVSLSEYRLRMKESPSKNRPAETNANAKKNNILSISTAVSLDTTYEKQLSLAPLRLKGDSKAATSALQQNKSKKTPKPKEAVASADEISKTVEKPQETLKERLSLTERLRREFGLEDDPEEEKSSPIPVHVSQPKSLPTSVPSSIKMAPVLSMVAQHPPPPPPPRLPRANLQSPATPFNYPLTAPFARTPFIVPQVQSNPYINHQPPMTAAAHPSLHHQLATPHSMLPMMPPYSAISGGAATLRPQVPSRDYATSVNAQNFASLVQPPPNPQGYHPMYQAGYFK